MKVETQVLSNVKASQWNTIANEAGLGDLAKCLTAITVVFPNLTSICDVAQQ